MQEFNADFHLHGPRSIGVSKDMDLPNLIHGGRQKGLDLIGTGDCFQPDWLKYLKSNLEQVNGEYVYDDMRFILQTEVEDEESVHEIILFPDFEVLEEIKSKFRPHSKNIDAEWGGRPRVNLPPTEIVEIVVDSGGMVGPAHVFTPFKSIFRQGKFDSLEEAYGGSAKDVHFLELGLSANSDYADRISGLHRLTFMSNSDAHSPTPSSLGREFNSFVAEDLSFEEVQKAIKREDGRRFTRNAGFSPKLGKYNVLFCSKCRKRVLVSIKKPKQDDPVAIFGQKMKVDDEFIKVQLYSKSEYKNYLLRINAGKVYCPACKSEGKRSKIKLGVSDRVKLLADRPKGTHPSHRPPYLDMVPLTEMLRSGMGIKSKNSKTLGRIYDALIEAHGPEIQLLLNQDVSNISAEAFQKQTKRYPDLISTLKGIIIAFRNNEISFKPGGGGTFGQLVFEA